MVAALSKLDARLAGGGVAAAGAKTLPALQRRVEFRPAIRIDSKMEDQRHKYTPVNGTNGSAAAGTVLANGTTSVIAATGDALVDENGFRRPARILYPPSKLASGWTAIRNAGPGLQNLGNSCFMNAVLQCLTYTPPLCEYLLSRTHSHSCRSRDFCMMCELETHVVKAFKSGSGSSSSSTGTITPSSIFRNLRVLSKRLRPGRQEDSHEFLRMVIDAMQTSCLRGLDPKLDNRIKETSLVHQIFGGYLQSQVHCTVCGYNSNTFDPILDLSLDVARGESVERGFETFTQKDFLVKDNKYKCERCNKLVNAEKQFTVYQAPRILTVHLKRFTPLGTKIGKHVRFEPTLDLTPHMAEAHAAARQANKSGDPKFNKKMKKHQQQHQQSIVQDLANPNGERLTYSLYAVLVHAGSTSSSGHYYSYVKAPSGQWLEKDDSFVKQVGLKTVLAQKAYILFYQLDKPKQLKSVPQQQREQSQKSVKQSTAQMDANEDDTDDSDSDNDTEPIKSIKSTKSTNMASPSNGKKRVRSDEAVEEDTDKPARSVDATSSIDRKQAKKKRKGLAPMSNGGESVTTPSTSSTPSKAAASVKSLPTMSPATSSRIGAEMAKRFTPTSTADDSDEADVSSQPRAGYISKRFPIATSEWVVEPTKPSQPASSVNGFPKKTEAEKAANDELKKSMGYKDRSVISQFGGNAIAKWTETPSTSSFAALNDAAQHDDIIGQMDDEERQRKREMRLSAYDAEYDTGKKKKSKVSKILEAASLPNRFQQHAEGGLSKGSSKGGMKYGKHQKFNNNNSNANGSKKFGGPNGGIQKKKFQPNGGKHHGGGSRQQHGSGNGGGGKKHRRN
ncbi:cysteine proteinase [Ramicandelaber brevisporus]|nr:cysteine proteinase [Ramicandelaber brevisporus]